MPDAPAPETRASGFRWRIEGHAILSPEDCIADASGAFPPALGDVNDWARFQAALDACAATVLARASHEATPNAARRLRVVMSRSRPRPRSRWALYNIRATGPRLKFMRLS